MRVTQFVPLDCIIVNFPRVAARIDVPAVSLPRGITLDALLVTLFAVIVFMIRILPGKLDAVGRVTVQLVVVNRSE